MIINGETLLNLIKHFWINDWTKEIQMEIL